MCVWMGEEKVGAQRDLTSAFSTPPPITPNGPYHNLNNPRPPFQALMYVCLYVRSDAGDGCQAG